MVEPSGEVPLGVGGEADGARVEGELESSAMVVLPLLSQVWRSGGSTEIPSSRVRCEGEPIGWKKLLVLLLAR